MIVVPHDQVPLIVKQVDQRALWHSWCRDGRPQCLVQVDGAPQQAGDATRQVSSRHSYIHRRESRRRNVHRSPVGLAAHHHVKGSGAHLLSQSLQRHYPDGAMASHWLPLSIQQDYLIELAEPALQSLQHPILVQIVRQQALFRWV